MRKLTAFLLTVLMLLSLCACDSASGSSAGSGDGRHAAATDSDLTQEEIDRILAEMEEAG